MLILWELSFQEKSVCQSDSRRIRENSRRVTNTKVITVLWIWGWDLKERNEAAVLVIIDHGKLSHFIIKSKKEIFF